MTPTVILNLIVSIAAIGGLVALMRAAYVAADGRTADPQPDFRTEPAYDVELERAA
jgi:hypothetical protein